MQPSIADSGLACVAIYSKAQANNCVRTIKKLNVRN
jgi:hypothetical protein